MDEDPGARAAERAEAARQRSAELNQRLDRLRRGEPVDPLDVERAEVAAEEARERAAAMHASLAEARESAAAAHESVADAAETAGQQGFAEAHRAEAASDRQHISEQQRAAERDRRASNQGPPSVP